METDLLARELQIYWRENNMIPRKIHYVWVGGNPLTPLAEKCIESWKKFCPDYEIVRWDESNFDINENTYCKQAYEKKKWAFVSDYIRLKVLYEHGGVYLDTDVEVIKNIDKFLKYPAFSGFENETNVQTGVIASEKNNLWIKRNLDFYSYHSFIKKNGSLDLTTNVITITNITKKMYPQIALNNTEQHFESVSFFPKDYFCPLSYVTKELEITKNTHMIHHFAGSWIGRPSLFQKIIKKIKSVIKKIIGKKNMEKYRAWKKEKVERKRD